MYCGDETGSFIGDIGSHTARFGYGGDNAPSHVVPSIVAESIDTGKKTIPTSCYSNRWCDASKEKKFKTPMRLPECPDAQQPISDSVQYLQQGDAIQDWDAYEHVWMNALDALYVKDTLKHTTGGGCPPSETTTTTTAAGGVQSSTAMVRSAQAAAGDSKCVHPLLVVSPGCTHPVMGRDGSASNSAAAAAASKRELLKLTELMMETVGAGALFVAPTPMLAAFSHGRQTCLVVDIGASGTRVTPVVDGLLIKQAQRRSGRGGDWLSNCLWQAASLQQEKKIVLTPRYQVKAAQKSTLAVVPAVAAADVIAKSGIFHRWAMHDLMYELRTSEHVDLPQWWYDPTVPFVYPDSENSSSSGDDMDAESSTKHYELPDGTLIDLTTRIGKDLCRAPELLFSEGCPFQDQMSEEQKAASQAILDQQLTLSNLPLHKLVHSSLSAVADVDVRKDLAATILLTGGLSVVKNLEKRLSLELPRITSAAYKPKVLASRYDVERQCAAWIGGSVLTSLGSFQQLWLSKTEYEEYGGTLAIQRFP